MYYLSGAVIGVLVVLYATYWYLSGKYMPFFVDSPNSSQVEVIRRDFSGINERAVNSAVMKCYNFNSMDLSTESTYNTFIASFRQLSAYKEFQKSGSCPPEVNK